MSEASEDFVCTNCGRQSVIYTGAADEDARVVCRSCGAFLGMLAQFRRTVTRREPASITSRC